MEEQLHQRYKKTTKHLRETIYLYKEELKSLDEDYEKYQLKILGVITMNIKTVSSLFGAAAFAGFKYF